MMTDGGERFVHVPSLDAAKLSQHFRSTVIGFFVQRRLINERLAKNMLDWTHSGFGDLTVKIPTPPRHVSRLPSTSPGRQQGAALREAPALLVGVGLPALLLVLTIVLFRRRSL